MRSCNEQRTKAPEPRKITARHSPRCTVTPIAPDTLRVEIAATLAQGASLECVKDSVTGFVLGARARFSPSAEPPFGLPVQLRFHGRSRSLHLAFETQAEESQAEELRRVGERYAYALQLPDRWAPRAPAIVFTRAPLAAGAST